MNVKDYRKLALLPMGNAGSGVKLQMVLRRDNHEKKHKKRN